MESRSRGMILGMIVGMVLGMIIGMLIRSFPRRIVQGMLLPLSDDVDYRSAVSLGDNVSDAWRRVRPYLEESPGASVLVVGGGACSIGLYAAAMACALGASSVDYVDSDSRRLALAGSVGANPIGGALSDHRGRERRPRRARLYAHVVGAWRRLHERRHLFRPPDAGAAAGHVRYRRHLQNRTRERRRHQPPGARTDQERAPSRRAPGDPVGELG